MQDIVEKSTRRILIVDDDELQLRAATRLAKRDPRIELLLASNPIDALLMVGVSRPDVIVLDVYMPGMDGFEVCRRIKANPDTREIQIIIASATMDAELAETAHAAGAAHAVAKPVDLQLAFAEPIVAREQTIELEPAAPGDAVRSLPETMRGADLLVDMLEDAGVEIVFGIPGGAISPIHDALLDSPIRTITTRHESGAMFAAAGYAQTTGKLAVVAVTSGPGMLNAMTGLASAWCDGLPVLLLVGEVPRSAHGKGVLQDGSAHGLQLVEMARHVTKLSVEVPRPSALPHLVRRAITTALSGKQGPVMLTLPMDVTTTLVRPPRMSGSIPVAEMLAPETIAEVEQQLRSADQPLILAGSGSRAAARYLRRLAELLRCPVATTPKGKGVFPEDHPLALGVLGMGGHDSARAYLANGVDLVLAVGTSLGDIATDGFAPELQARTLIHVDVDARQIGKSYEPTHAVIASAAHFLGAMVERFESMPLRGRLRETPSGVSRMVLPASAAPHRIGSHDAIREIQQALPRDTIFTVDSGEHFLFAAHYLEIRHPDSFVVMTGLGSMGQSIGAAIGAQLANRSRTVAAICGDGCFAMNAFEIATAVAERVPIRVFVFNDGVLGMVEKGHSHVYGRTPAYATGPVGPLDVCAIARGLGAMTTLIDGNQQLAQVEELLRSYPGPVVVDVRIDPAIRMRGKDRVAAMTPASVAVPVLAKPPSEPTRVVS
ncbi:MAG TPA: thiamine pyrophosphate-binding protein [Kofleriaceae bacterium]|nr:thiamine pyrophosphate-binding protein [Kofleriaceae bacterium]